MSTITQPIKWHGGKPVFLTNGGHAFVSEADYTNVNQYRWYRDTLGYARRNAGNGRCEYMHRAVMPGCDIVDHINGNKLDNRRCNLRPCTKAQNAHNAKRHRDKTSSRFKGVHFDRARGKWSADIMANGSRRRLGRFETEHEAAEAYRLAAEELHGEFANADHIPN